MSTAGKEWPPKLKRWPKEVSGCAGDPLEIEVDVTGKPKPTVNWMKDGDIPAKQWKVTVSEIPESQANNDKKKKVENNEKPTMFRVTLKVAESAPDDSGIYTLTVTNSRGDQTARISVGVHVVAPKLKVNPKELSVYAGDPLEIKADVFGAPQPTLKWLKDGSPVGKRAETEVVHAQGRDDNQPAKLKLKLKVAMADFDDSGKYTIKATNTDGEDTADINVVVLRKPPKLTLNAKEIRVYAGDILEIKANVSGAPEPTVKWQKDGVPVGNWADTEVTEALVRDYKHPKTLTVKLKVSIAAFEDRGKYTIKVTNIRGEDTADISVVVADRGLESIIKMKSEIKRGDIAFDRKDYAAAVGRYQNVLTLAETVEHVIEELATKLQQRAQKLKKKFDLPAEMEKMKAAHSFCLCREKAVLHCKMAEAYKQNSNINKAYENAEKSIEYDETYCKPYILLGEKLISSKQYPEACEKFYKGLSCAETTLDDRLASILEIVKLLPHIEDETSKSIVKQVKDFLQESWSEVFDSLIQSGSLDIVRRLVLGPPYAEPEHRSAFSIFKSAAFAMISQPFAGRTDSAERLDGWEYADRYSKGTQQQVGIAMRFKLHTKASIASLLKDVHRGGMAPDVCEWVTDLVLALLLQGPPLQTLLKADTASCYHVALCLCCSTGKLGLIRYILSIDHHLYEAVTAVDNKKQTLLHLACSLNEGDSVQRKEVVRLLLKKGLDPMAVDSNSRKAVDLLRTHDNSLWQQLKRATDVAQSKQPKSKVKAARKDLKPCESCSDTLRKVDQCKDVVRAFSSLVGVFSCQHSLDNVLNKDLLHRTTSDVVERFTIGIKHQKEISSIILQVPEPHFQQILQEMFKSKKWEELTLLVDLAKEAGRGPFTFIFRIAIVDVIRTDKPSDDKEKLLRLLFDHGAMLPNNPKLVVNFALEKNEIGVVEVLLDNGLNPELLSPDEHDKDVSPVHAAFKVDVSKGRGNFSLFEKLFSSGLYRRKTDAHGNTLLHLAMQEDHSERSYEAVKYLVSKDLVDDNWNDDEKMAIDFLTKHDERAQELIEFFIKRMEKLSEEELQAAKAGEDRWLEEKALEKKEALEEKGPEELSVGQKDTHLSEPAKEKCTSGAPSEDCHASDRNSKKDEEQDELTFEGLPWEVVLTEEAWNKLQSKMPPDLKRKIINIIKRLASGEMRGKDFRQLPNAKPIRLYEANISRGERLIWELAIAFSALKSTSDQPIYTDVIRVWDIVHHGKIYHSVQRIMQSHKRGEGCLSSSMCIKLKALPAQRPSAQGHDLGIPTLYTPVASGGTMEVTDVLYPPASADETQYHILKFYDFTSNLEFSMLQNTTVKTDFLFRVTELESKVINLCFDAPVLLVGRSGTGKTTCCLYRLWTQFLKYWTSARDRGYESWYLCHEYYGTVQDHACKKSECTSGTTAHGGKRHREGKAVSDTDAAACAAAGAAAGACANVPEPELRPSALSGSSKSTAWSQNMAKSIPTTHTELIRQNVHLHQMFVTKNKVLCTQVRKNFQELCRGEPVALHHVDVEKDLLPHRLQDMDEYKFPLFLTSRQLIIMLDASLPAPHFFERNEDGSMRTPLQDAETAVYDLLDDVDEDMNDDCIEEDQECRFKSSKRQRHSNPVQRREVTYEVFSKEIWPRIKDRVRVKYHPSLVWMEITSFIKGSFKALAMPEGCLDRKGYEEVGRKQAPNFTGDRQKVYDLFELYTKYIRQYGLYDEGDILFHVYNRLKSVQHECRQSWVIHETYVDETQDFTQAELFLLICLTDQPNRLFLTGDTAQSIMRGVAFRFADLKSIFYQAKELRFSAKHAPPLVVPSTVHQLTDNCRSHDGILRLAAGILDLLVAFFPESLDNLEPDQGLFEGPKPVLLESASPDQLISMLRGNRRETSHIEFGAHQAILVVSKEARNNLPQKMRRGIRLTIYESKGLEFDDILLYNFFKDSQAETEWQVVLSCMLELCQSDSKRSSRGLVRIDEDALLRKGVQGKNFDENKHKILNSELKHLYTAVTRARANVYIFDEDEKKRAPMFRYFKARDLVTLLEKGTVHKLPRNEASKSAATPCTASSSSVDKSTASPDGADRDPLFARRTSAESWERRGDELMKHKLYDQAANCYTNANNKLKVTMAVAHARAKTAAELQAQSQAKDVDVKVAYQKAAILFLECHAESVKQNRSPEQRFYLATMGAAKCLIKGGKHSYAAQVFEKNLQIKEAVVQYRKAKCWQNGSMCLEQINFFHSAILFLDKGHLYDEALDCLDRYNKAVKDYARKGQPLPERLVSNKPGDDFTERKLLLKKAQACHQRNAKEEMLSTLKRLNSRDSEQFLWENKYFDEAAAIMIERGARSEAVLMMLHYGENDRGIQLAEEGDDKTLRAHCYLKKARVLRAAKIVIENPGQPPTEVPTGTQGEQRALLSKALEVFQQTQDHFGIGECLLLQSRLEQDEKLMQRALQSFRPSGQQPNFAGIVECIEALYRCGTSRVTMELCEHLLEGVEVTSELVCLLFKTNVHTAEERHQYRLSLHFFGLEATESASLSFYPGLHPRWIDISTKTWQEHRVELSGTEMTKVLQTLAEFLTSRAMEWHKAANKFIHAQFDQKTQCLLFQLGKECCDHHLHAAYSKDQTERVLKLLAWHIWLDHSTGCITEHLPKLTKDAQPEPWNSVLKLLTFLVPEGLPAYHMDAVSNFCISVQKRKTRLFRQVHNQIQKFVLQLKKTPCWEKAQPQESLLRQKCRSTNWIVLASFLTNLFALKGEHDAFCNKLEQELAEEPIHNIDWMKNRQDYVVWTDKEMTTRLPIVRRHLEAVAYLMFTDSSTQFDPFEALIKFTQFTKLLCDRGKVAMMPELNVFLFWLETFTTVALSLTLKLPSPEKFSKLVPACYIRNIRLLSQTFPNREQSLQQRLEEYGAPPRIQKTLQSRIQYLIQILCGIEPKDFNLLDHLSEKLKPKTLQNWLQLERCLVLSLVLLINTQSGTVSENDPILLAVRRLKTEEMPPRLKTLVEKTSAARDCEEINSALSGALHSISEWLQNIRWHWTDHSQQQADVPPLLRDSLHPSHTEEWRKSADGKTKTWSESADVQTEEGSESADRETEQGRESADRETEEGRESADRETEQGRKSAERQGPTVAEDRDSMQQQELLSVVDEDAIQEQIEGASDHHCEQRTGSHPEGTVAGENHHRSLQRKVDTSYQEGSRRRRKGTDPQPEIAASASAPANDTERKRRSVKEERGDEEGIIATLQRIERKMEEDRKQTSTVNTRLLSDMSAMRKENAVLQKKTEALEKTCSDLVESVSLLRKQLQQDKEPRTPFQL